MQTLFQHADWLIAHPLVLYTGIGRRRRTETMRFTVTKTPSGYQILEAGIATPIAILQSESCALRACEELNRWLIERQDVLPDGSVEIPEVFHNGRWM